ncbi:hypothetical protein ILFOPFJJ_01821 [Ensifer psoraleae]|uniref:hypothetical protein n=1 Tax=Sinorhizobium psoraleae TaxID=520838 RepID=UPI0015682BB2|nr:hypothetical protein [Sinorhizobium psoraleae]NRP70939.1 hypothetical protein [Sinorhizobium psoraleae]
MKSPWNFLVQLSSQRRLAKAQDSVAHDADPEALDSEAENTFDLPSDNPTETSSTSDHDAGVPVDQVSMLSDKPNSDSNLARAMSPPIDAQEADIPAPGLQHSGAEADAVGPKSETSTKPQRKPRVKRRERSKKTRVHQVARSAVATNEGQSVQPSSSEDSFFNEVAIVEEEIKELRRRLAQKIYLQNIQLKKMLERFDVS